ncbi:amidohydrolase family protein [Haloarcula rubripromontorii]|uniref:Amidohydrolase family protein n=1 Tax=Haloarcula rubripromontorii TaxID=1705562 RepID=A0A0N0BNI8_9EURY|nr:amidohydrolase family protein [Haloarcula rubripromontorii]KOX92570.1 N-ethylammeline chlorohydrolase [Haloarcula rubripromontorii]NLV04708.1 amidohydrolase family protein [Haloarcula rubripromontorii]
MILNAGTLITMDDERTVRSEGHVVVENGDIVAIEDGYASGGDVIDATDEVVIPGLVNCHTHMYALPIRGAPLDASPESFYEALVDIWWNVDEAFTERDARLSALGSCAEMLQSGVTTFCDNYSGPNTLPGGLDAVAEGVSQTPIRGMISFETTARNSEAQARDGIAENKRFIDEAEDRYDSVSGHYCLHTLFTNTEDIVGECVDRATDDDRPIQIHLEEGLVDVHESIADYGKRPVPALEDMGFFDAEVIAAHCVHSTESEIEILAENDVSVAHNPYSNINNAVGVADVETMQAHEMTIGLGDDGWDPDMFETMRSAVGIHKLKQRNPSGFDMATALEWATIGSAAVLGMDDAVGSIEVGKRGDFVTLDLGPNPVLDESAPYYVVSAASRGDVTRTIIDGVPVYDQNSGVAGVDDSDMAAVGDASAELWDRL